jgi:uncharacterized membrane protein
VNDPNPYTAPHASLEMLPGPDTGGFLGEPRRVPVDAGMGWIAAGWQSFLAAPGHWIALFLVWVIVFVVVSLVPLVGGIAANLLMMIMMAGIALGCDAQRRGETLEISHLFAAWNSPARNPLLVLGLLYMVASIIVAVVMVVVMLVAFGGFAAFGGQGQAPSDAVMVPMMIVFVLLMLAVMIPLAMAIWFAPPLVAINGLAPMDAMKSSFDACARNLGAVIVYGIVATLVTIAGMIPLLLGLLVTSPVLMASSYAAYRQIYYED